MELKHLKIAALLTLTLTATTAVAKEYKIPATQEEFDAQWTIVPGEVNNAWTLVNDTETYVSTPSVSDGEKGSTLILSEPIEMNEGDIYYIQAKVSSNNYNYAYFYLVYGTDKDNLQPISTSSSDLRCYGKSTGVNFKVYPTNTSKARILNVTESGKYYIGIRSWKPESPTNLSDLCVSSLYIEKAVDYPAKVNGGKAVALDRKMDATITWTWPTKTNNGATIDEELSANIYRGTSNSKADLYKEENIIGHVSGGVAGGKGEFVDDPDTSSNPITEPGQYYYYVAPINAEGENSDCSSSTAISCKWIGEETKFQPILNSSYYPIKAAMIDESSVSISFTPRKDAVNGGWYDEDQIFLKVTRKLGSGEPVVVTESAPMVSPFIDNTITEPGTYTYYLYVVYKGNESSSTKVDPLFAGGSFPLPFSDDFSDKDSFGNFTVITTNTSYKWNLPYSGGYLQYNSYSTGASSIVATPPLKVEAGKTYHISCTSWKGNSSSDKSLDIVEGKSTSAATDLKTIKAFEITATSASNKETLEAYYSPTESGIHYFGFRASGTSNYIYLDDVLVEEIEPSPAAVADLVAAPDAEGALKSHVSFTIPSTTNAGSPLASIESVVVSRIYGEDVTVVRNITGEDCVPGAKVEFDDAVEEAGMYAYQVVSSTGGKDSEVASTEAAWVGYDVPKAVSSFTVRADVNTKGGADIKWTGISGTTLGVHGGYVDAANLKYRIYRAPQLFDADTEIIAEVSESPYTDSELSECDWNRYGYLISVLNGTQESTKAESNKISGGVMNPDEFEHDLTNPSFIDALDGRAYESGNDALCFRNRGETDGTDFVVYFPQFKVNAATGKKFKLNLKLSRGNADYEELLEVFLCTVEVTAPTPANGNTPDTEAAVIAGSDARELIKTIPVHAMAEDPANEEVAITVPEEGRYRIALRCASAENKLLNIHTLALATDNTTGIEDAVINDGSIAVGVNGNLILPEDTAAYAVYRVDGALVASGNGAETIALGKGLYIVKIVKIDGTSITTKIVK